MRWTLALLACLTACPPSETDTDPVDIDTDTDTDTDTERPTGRQVYAGRCASCHGAEAQGTSAGYELRHPSRPYATWVIRAGRPGDEFPSSYMPGWGDQHLDELQLEELFDWLDAFERPTTGAGLYADFCANCHGPDAAGGVSRSDIRGRDLERIIPPVREGLGGDGYGVRRSFMPATSADALSDAELEAIAAWLATR
jgi:mono/diheme cytochrome c family protein